MKRGLVERPLVVHRSGGDAFEGSAHGGRGSGRLTHRRGGADTLTGTLERGSKKEKCRFRRR
jgi:hypothetical protein